MRLRCAVRRLHLLAAAAGLALFTGCGGSSEATGGADAAIDAGDAIDAIEDTSTGDATVDGSASPDADDDATDASPDASPDASVDAGPADVLPDASPDAPSDAAPPPSCTATSACPATPAGLVEGGGPRAIDRCAFVLRDAGRTGAYASVIAALQKSLPTVTIDAVLGDLNRTAKSASAASFPGVPGFQRAFAWDADDEGKAWWIPQGLTGSFDANAAGTVAGRKVVIATWYYDLASQPGATDEKGIRVSVADVTGANVTYRHVLLVEPKMNGARADFVPIPIHAGGVAWVGDRLWVADTGRGLRGFDLTKILQVSAAKEVVGWDAASSAYQGGLYKYVLPQIEAWDDGSPCNPVFSFVALDRTSTPPALVTGEYSATAITGRVLRFPVDLATGALAPVTYAHDAYVMGQRQVQGGLTHGGVFWLSSSAPAAGGGVLYATRPGVKTKSYTWVDAPEDLLFDPKANQLWGLSEAIDARWVFAVDASKVAGP